MSVIANVPNSNNLNSSSCCHNTNIHINTKKNLYADDTFFFIQLNNKQSISRITSVNYEINHHKSTILPSQSKNRDVAILFIYKILCIFRC